MIPALCTCRVLQIQNSDKDLFTCDIFLILPYSHDLISLNAKKSKDYPLYFVLFFCYLCSALFLPQNFPSKAEIIRYGSSSRKGRLQSSFNRASICKYNNIPPSTQALNLTKIQQHSRHNLKPKEMSRKAPPLRHKSMAPSSRN